MHSARCPHCAKPVSVVVDGDGDQRRVELVAAAEPVGAAPGQPSGRGSAVGGSPNNPYVSPLGGAISPDGEKPPTGLTTHERIYLSVVMLFAVIALLGAVPLTLVGVFGEDGFEPVFLLPVALSVGIGVVLGATSGWMLYQNRLLFAPTVIQGVLACLMVYLAPLGIAAFVLLYQRTRREGAARATAKGRFTQGF